MNIGEITYPETPAGKRVAKQNIYGNWIGYVSGRRFWEFGTYEKSAKFWEQGNSLRRSFVECWVED